VVAYGVGVEQGCVLQLLLSDSAGQALPPFAGATNTERLCVCVPPSQV